MGSWGAYPGRVPCAAVKGLDEHKADVQSNANRKRRVEVGWRVAVTVPATAAAVVAVVVVMHVGGGVVVQDFQTGEDFIVAGVFQQPALGGTRGRASGRTAGQPRRLTHSTA